MEDIFHQLAHPTLYDLQLLRFEGGAGFLVPTLHPKICSMEGMPAHAAALRVFLLRGSWSDMSSATRDSSGY